MKVCLHCQRPVEPSEGGRCGLHDQPLVESAERALAPDDMIGRALGDRFRLETFLGQGGMGTVFVARHELLDRDFAIKVLDTPRGADELLSARFLREARTASRVRHPHVIDITDFGVTRGGSLFLVMELLPGRHLRDVIVARAPMPVRAAARLTIQICQALEAIHGAGVVHRDLKPENCQVLNPDDPDDLLNLKVLDFGIAALLEPGDGARLTGEGAVVGTPAYMAPEQVSGHAVDARADVYAVGCILFELLTGAAFVEAKSAPDALVRQLMQPVRPPSNANPAVPAWLDEVVVACLAKEPDERPGSAAMLRDWLETDLESAPDMAHAATLPGTRPAPPARAPEPLVTPAAQASVTAQTLRRRRPLRLAMAGLVALLVAVAAGAFGYFSERSSSAAPIEAQAPRSLPAPPSSPNLEVVEPAPVAPAPVEVAPAPAPTPPAAAASAPAPTPSKRPTTRRVAPPAAAAPPVSAKKRWDLVPDDL